MKNLSRRLIWATLALGFFCHGILWTDSAPAHMKPDPDVSPSPSPSPSPPNGGATVIEEKGTPFQVRWLDGRVATLMISHGRPPEFRLPFEVTENTCNGRERIVCNYLPSFEIVRYQLKWTIHPDPEKVGADVSFVFSGPDGNKFKYPVSDLKILSISSKSFTPILASRLGEDLFVCSDYSWLPGGSGSVPPSSVALNRWETESMFENPETGLQENRSNGGAIGVELEAVEGDRLKISKVEAFTSRSTNTSLVEGDLISWILGQPGGQYCQYTLKVDLTAAEKTVNEFLVNPPKDFVPYIVGSDECSSGAVDCLSTQFRNFKAQEVE